MAITLNGSIQQADNVSDTNTTSLTGTNSGESVIVGCCWRDTGGITITGVTVGGTAATSTTAQVGGSPEHRQQFWYLASLASGGTKSVVVTFSSGVLARCYSLCIAGADTGAFLDDHQVASGTGTTASVSVTTDAAGAAIFALTSAATVITGVGSGYTDIDMPNFWQWVEGEYDLDVGAAGSKAVDRTLFESATWIQNAIAVKAAGGGGAAAASTLMLMGIGA